MRDTYLETAQYPHAVFTVTGIQPQSAKSPSYAMQEVVQLRSTGRLTLHGKTVQKTIPLKVTYIPESAATHNRFRAGNLIRIQGEFPVPLNAHDIKVPTLFSQKLASTVMVKIDVFGTDNPNALNTDSR
jgi:polyisoprenoid-binding protein YceI